MKDQTLDLKKRNTKQNPKAKKIGQVWPKKRDRERKGGLEGPKGGKLNKHQRCRSRKGGQCPKKGEGRLVGFFRQQETGDQQKGVLAQERQGKDEDWKEKSNNCLNLQSFWEKGGGEGRLIAVFRHQEMNQQKGAWLKKRQERCLRLVGLLQSLKLQGTSEGKTKKQKSFCRWDLSQNG
jgi:hypothetical protein